MPEQDSARKRKRRTLVTKLRKGQVLTVETGGRTIVRINGTFEARKRD